ncbi:hypothetical protein GGR20_000078 [Devosia subaequoris]|uniref:Uncharacterized protein n=1 Tax=Devosia subaequoris TaxID=395930 RepID=A0A7W6IIW3_9HYPH|nr:hypothetical protein [Devosia subaequoris]MBB4050460.1 hypothetical protein [Devosia subaequoris]MCP1208852.1 hypothetical protein [Devosia subaequoris]
MSLNTLLTQLGLQRHDPHSLEAQLHAMRRDVHGIRQSLSRQTGQAANHWGNQLHDIGSAVATQTSELAQLAGQEARKGAGMIRRDPVPAIALAGTALLLMRLLNRR